MKRSPCVALAAAAAVLLAGCDCGSQRVADADAEADSGAADAGSRDATTLDSGTVDAASREAGNRDSAIRDSGTLDAGSPGPAPDLGDGVVTSRFYVANARGELIDTVLVAPTTAGPHPAVLVAHGSGGLFRMPAASDTGTCSNRMESQFERWATRLAGLGFVIVLADSFGPRGYCDFNDDPRKDDAYPPLSVDADGKTRRLIDRIYDTVAVLEVLASRSDVRADRIGLLGFSNGASTVMLYLHHRLSAAFDEFRATSDAQALGVSLPPLPTTVVPVEVGVAYYPGCGFDGLLRFSTDISNLTQFYYPSAPLRVNHAELDPLLSHCSVTTTGTREIQADTYAVENSLPDHYDVAIYNGASHGFDSADCEGMTTSTDPDVVACAEALAATLARFMPLLEP